MLTTSVPLRRFGASGELLTATSGVLVDYEGRRFLIAAAHAVPRGTSGWALEISHDPVHGTEVLHLAPFAYLAEYRRDTATLRELDLCVVQVPNDLVCYYENRTPRALLDKRPRHVFAYEPAEGLGPGNVYAFSGQIRREQHSPTTFAVEMVVYPGLTHLRTDNEIEIFQLPVEHPGHDAFQGCSGAPVVSRERKVVAIVVEGDIQTNTIRALSIKRALPALKTLAANLPAR
jgi:hypothetical protein